MANEWREATVGEIAARTRNALVGGPFGSNLVSADYVESGIPVIRGQNMGSRWVGGDFAYVSDAKAQALEANLARPRDIVFTQRGTLGQVSLVPEGKFDRYIVSQSQMKLTVDPALADPIFVYYLFTTPEKRDYIRQNAIQTGVPHTNLGILRATPVLLPSLPEQRAVASMLSALDDKIELNRRINETLEAMARALFKAWFLESEHSGSWVTCAMANCVDVVRGLSYKGDGLANTGAPMHNLNSIYESGGYKNDGIKHYDGAYKPHHLVKAGDLIVANTEQGHDRLLIGYAALVPERFGNESLFSHHLYRVRPKADCHLTAEYLCHLLNSRTMHDTVSGYANGTTVNMLSMDGLQLPEVAIPPKDLVGRFTAFARSVRLRQEAMIEENRALAATRDALLPKLISGEIRVPEARKMSEEPIQ